MGKGSVFIAAIFIAACTFVSSSGQSQTHRELEERKWRYTQLNIRWVDDTISQSYCSANERFFRGCFAAVEGLAQMVDPRNLIHFQKDVKKETGSKEVQLTLVKDGNPIDPETAEELKDYWKSERARYAAIEKLDLKSATSSLIDLYQSLKSEKKNFEPYEVARLLNKYLKYTYDPNTVYRPNIKYDGTVISPPNAIMGVGFDFQTKSVKVVKVLKDSEAEKSGLKIGDVLTDLDDVPVSKMDEVEFQKRLKKNAGDTAKLSVLRGEKNLVFNIPFSKVDIPNYVYKTMNQNNKTWGYLYLFDFIFMQSNGGKDACDSMRDVLTKANSSTDGLILDMRGNEGGNVDLAVCLLDLVIGQDKKILAFKALDLPTIANEYSVSAQNAVYKKPLVVLQDIHTASAGEIVSGTIKLMGRGLVVGTRSYGKGTVQVAGTVDVLDYYQTSFAYYLANGRSPEFDGITPQISSYVLNPPAAYEINSLRAEDVGLHPIVAEPIAPLETDLKEMAVPRECLASKNVSAQFQAMSDYNPTKDLQMLTGLATLECIP